MPETAWILVEEEALKAKLQGVTVADRRNPEGMPVKVWFNLPEEELRDRQYPYITIALIAINHATDREHRGYLYQSTTAYTLPGEPPLIVRDENDNLLQESVYDYPIPYDLIFQITTWSRTARHDHQMLGALLGTHRLPHRFGRLEVGDTTRRLDLISVIPADTRDENNKRLFRKIYTVLVSSEMHPHQAEKVATARSVQISVTPRETIQMEIDSAL